MKPGLITVTLIEFIAATPCSDGIRPSPAMTKFEKPKNTPPTKAAPNAAAKLIPVTRLSGILFLQHLGRLQAIGDAIKVHRSGTAAPAREGQPARRRPEIGRAHV